MEATRLTTNKNDKSKVAIFLNLAGEDVQDNIYNYIYTIVIKAFKEKSRPIKNETYERFKFFSRMQQENEEFEHYITEIKTLAKTSIFWLTGRFPCYRQNCRWKSDY